MTVFHVDAVNGNNSNDGLSEEAAVQTVQNAFTKAVALVSTATEDIEIAARGNWPHNFAAGIAINATHNRPNGYRLKFRSYDGTATLTARTPITGWASVTTHHPRAVRAAHSGAARDLYCDAGFEPRRATFGEFNDSFRVHAWEPATKSVLIPNATAPTIAALGGLVMAIQIGWNMSYLPVANIVNGPTGYKRVTFAEPCASVEFEKGTFSSEPGTFQRGPYHLEGQRFWWENRVEFMEKTGDYVKWNDYFYVVLPVGMTAAAFDALGAYIPNGVQTLFNIAGNNTVGDWDTKADNIDFEDFHVKHVGYVPTDFEADGWVGYNSNTALRDISGTTGFIQLTGVITAQKARSISIRNVRNSLCSVPLLRVWNSVQGLNLDGIACHDTDSSPIILAGSVPTGTSGGVPWTSLYDQPPEAQNRDLRMVDCIFKNTARVYMGYAATLGLWRKARVQRNLIEGCPGGAIQIGLGARFYEMWDFDWDVDHNEIRDVLTILTDAGAIYTNGNQCGRMPNAPVPLHQFSVQQGVRIFCNLIENVYKSGYDVGGGDSVMIYHDLGSQGNVAFGNYLKNGSQAFNSNGALRNSYIGNKIENVDELKGIYYVSLNIFPRGSNTGIRTYAPVNNPPTANDLNRFNATGPFEGAVPFWVPFPFPSAAAVVNPDGSFNHLSRFENNGPDVPWDVKVGPRAEIRERYADLFTA